MSPPRSSSAPVLVIGGAGFIGSNLAAALARDGEAVRIFDNLSRPGVERNLAWLERSYGAQLDFYLADIRDRAALDEALDGIKAVYHLASQVAVTTSLVDPVHDFTINASGTLQVLEAIRHRAPEAPVVFASTNKVYGNLTSLSLAVEGDRYLPLDTELRRHGIDEAQPLEFCTPYGCSKGTADQYVLDYAHSFGLRSAVLRMSCIYGPRQFGTEDQGWIAHFLLRALRDEPITLYGDGWQVRDVLHVNDAVAAYRLVSAALAQDAEGVAGTAFNLGGGSANAVSLAQVLAEIAELSGRPAQLTRQDWRTGDQLYFVADTRRLTRRLGWHAAIDWRDGLRDLAQWISTELDLPIRTEEARLPA